MPAVKHSGGAPGGPSQNAGAEGAGDLGRRRPVWPTIRRLWVYLARHKWMLVLAVFLSAGGNLLALLGPWLSGLAIDAIEPGRGAVDFERVFFYCCWMVLFYAASAVLAYLLAVLMIKLSQRVAFKMREDTFNRLMDLPVGFFDAHQTGDILSRLSYDIDTVNATLSNDLVQLATSFVMVTGSLGMMLAISPRLTLVFAVTVPLSLGFSKWISGRVQPLFRRRSQKLGAMNGYVEETLTGLKTIKAYHREQVMTGRFDQRNEDAVQAYYRADYYGSMMGPSVNFINNLSLTFVSVLGAVLYLLGGLGLGSLSSFILYSRKFSGPINEAANIFGELQSAVAAAERVFNLLDQAPEPPDAPGAMAFGQVRGQVEMEHVAFGYLPGVPVLKNLNLVAEPGKLVAIVGHTGAGKTTLINLQMRFYDPNAGVIRLDGADIKTATRQSLRGSYAMVLQDTWLFHGTVAENIAYGRPGAGRDEIERAARAARVHGTIARLPQGYDTVLNEDGVNLSQGQRQLITIARAMLLDTRMLILDEATSNVDTRTEIQIQKAMLALMAGKTCFVIAHRLSTIMHADTILVMENGDVVEQGSHRALLESGGLYARLFNSQFE